MKDFLILIIFVVGIGLILWWEGTNIGLVYYD